MAVPFWAEVVAFRGSNFSQQAMCDALKAEKHQAESPESFRDRMLQVQEEFPEHLGVLEKHRWCFFQFLFEFSPRKLGK